VDSESNTWFDTNLINDKTAVQSIERISPTKWVITIQSVKDELEFESIGELNCNSGSQLINILVPTTPTKPSNSFDSISQAMYYLGLTVLWLSCIVLFFVINGINGNRPQIFNILQLFLGFYIFFIWINYSIVLAAPIIGVTLVVFIGGLDKH